jgi:hypothetical protein
MKYTHAPKLTLSHVCADTLVESEGNLRLLASRRTMERLGEVAHC